MISISSAIEYAARTAPEFILSNARIHHADGVEMVAIDLNTQDGEAAGTMDVWFEPLIGTLYGEW